MTDDDWNLKDEVSCGTGDAFDSYYTEETIEILRKKLIEDLNKSKLGFTSDSTEDTSYQRKYELAKMDAIDELIKIINKRFGVE